MNAVSRGRATLTGAAVLVLSLPTAPDAEAALEEIIVTATKRETSLMETAASLSAFDGSAFDLYGIEGSRDLVARTPSLTITTFRVAIRGVGRRGPSLAEGPAMKHDPANPPPLCPAKRQPAKRARA